MLSLSLKDVGLDPPHISIPRRGAKRVSRERYLELNGTAAWALERLIKRAIEELFKVKVTAVRTSRVHGKFRRMGNSAGAHRPDWKKAFVSVQPGQEIKILEDAQ